MSWDNYKYPENPNTDPPMPVFPQDTQLTLDHDATLPKPGGEWFIDASFSITCQDSGEYECDDLVLTNGDTEISGEAAFATLGDDCIAALEERAMEAPQW